MEGLIGYLFGLAIGIIGLVVAVYIITEDGGGCFAFGVAIICAITIALNATMLMAHAKEVSVTQTTEVLEFGSASVPSLIRSENPMEPNPRYSYSE